MKSVIRRIIALFMIITVVITIRNVNVYAYANNLSIDKAEDMIREIAGVPYTEEVLIFEDRIFSCNSQNYTVININNLVPDDKELYVFAEGPDFEKIYLVGVDTGSIYTYEGGDGYGTFNALKDGKINESWKWNKDDILKDGNFTGWDISNWKQVVFN